VIWTAWAIGGPALKDVFTRGCAWTMCGAWTYVGIMTETGRNCVGAGAGVSFGLIGFTARFFADLGWLKHMKIAITSAISSKRRTRPMRK